VDRAKDGDIGTGGQLRVAYLSGPSDADRIYSDILSEKVPTYFGTNYMRQFLLFMNQISAVAWIETWHGNEAKRRTIGSFTFNNVPESHGVGANYHFQQIGRQIGILWRLFRFRPNIVVLTGATNYWWIYAPLKIFGARFIASFHSVLWTRFHRLAFHQRLYRRLNQAFAYPLLNAAVLTSKEIEDQLVKMLSRAARPVPIFRHLPSYSRKQFQGLTPVSSIPTNPFVVTFIGRVEANKGVFDVVQIAKELELRRRGEFRFNICGSGSASEELQQRVGTERLESAISLHGYCGPHRIREVLSSSHAVIVPTRSEFDAGFEMTCAESILSGRPLITSAVCPALFYLREAAVEVEPDNVNQYREAIEALKDDRDLFLAKVDACAPLSEQFYDSSNSWDSAMRLALSAVLDMEISSANPPPTQKVRA
jgi:glycosyltransferase involved in cell wall biosynthesis